MGDDHRFVLTLSCPDRTGIVARITTFLADIGGWITEAAYHSDGESGRFFTRQEIRADSVPFGIGELRRQFGVVAGELGADHWQVADTAHRKTIVLMVSRTGTVSTRSWRVGIRAS
jgi:formyltetrahydrofolate deformylase